MTTSESFVCGMEESGFVSVGYPFCHLPPEWFQHMNGNPIVGKPGSFSGFAVSLSASGNFLVTAGHQNDHEAFIYDRDGSQWKLRAQLSFLDNEDEETVFFDLTSIHIREVYKGRVNNPRSLAPLEVSFLTNSSGIFQIYRCEARTDCYKEFSVATEEWSPYSAFDMAEDGSVLLVKTIVPGMHEAEVYFNDKARRSFSTPDATIFLLPDNFSDDIRIVMDARISDDTELVAMLVQTAGITDVSFDVLSYVWNGTGYSQLDDLHVGNATSIIEGEIIGSIGRGSFELSADGQVFAVALCDTEDRVLVFSWEADQWVRRVSPPIAGLPCTTTIDGATTENIHTSFLKLSQNGDVLAFAENSGYSETAVMTFEWNGHTWNSLGKPASSFGPAASLGLSYDGSVLTVGLPFERFDDGGETRVFSRPGYHNCAENEMLWRFSLTSKRSDYIRPWIFMNSQGLILESGASFDFDSTVVSELCLKQLDEECYSFIMFNDFGQQSPMYDMFLGSESVSNNTISSDEYRIREKVGSCPIKEPVLTQCPPGSSHLEVVSNVPSSSDRVAHSWRIVDLETGKTVWADDLNKASDSWHIENNTCLELDNTCHVFYSDEDVGQELFGTRLYQDGKLLRTPSSMNGPVFLGTENNGCCPDGSFRTILQMTTCGSFKWGLSVVNGADIAAGNETRATIFEEDIECERKVVWEDFCLQLDQCHNFTVTEGADATKSNVWFSADVMLVTRGASEKMNIFGNCSEGAFYGEPSLEPIGLANSIPLREQSGYTDQLYVLPNIPEGKNATCTLEGDNGDADLNVFFFGGSGYSCLSDDNGSDEMCQVGPAPPNATLGLSVIAFLPYTGLTVACFIEGEPIVLYDGIPLHGQSSTNKKNQMYILEQIESGRDVKCTLSGDNGDADLDIFFEGEEENGCGSYNVGSYEMCAIGTAANATVLYAEIIVYEPYTDVTILCSTGDFADSLGSQDDDMATVNDEDFLYFLESLDWEAGIVNLTSNVPLTGQTGDSGSQSNYALYSVGEGDLISCSLLGYNGDADLIVFFDLNGEPVNPCASFLATSNEECAVGPAPADAVLFVVVFANEDYMDLTITCSVLS